MENIDELIGIISIAGPSWKPTGVISINDNGIHDVAPFKYANVHVEGLVPSGTLTITENDTYDVTNYAQAEVNVPQGIFPTETVKLSSNGLYDVTPYAKALIDVHIPEYNETLLWTNPNLTQAFNAQSISLNVQDYDYIKLVYTSEEGAGQLNYKESYINVSELDNSRYPVFGFADSNNIANRTIHDSQSLSFSDCYVYGTVVNS